MKALLFIIIAIVLIVKFSSPQIFADDKTKKEFKQNSINKVIAVNPNESLININNVTSWIRDDGFHDWNVVSSWNGSFPIGESAGGIFAEGIVWGGKVYDGNSQTIRVNGNTYGTGCSSITRLFRVRPDYLSADLTLDAATFYKVSIVNVTPDQVLNIKNQYQLDWQEWPVAEGAPYQDVNKNGNYDATEDIPGIPGASQTLFIKYNDDLSESFYGSLPIGVKITETYWAYAVSGSLNNVIFKKVNLVYAGTPTSLTNSTIDSFYIAQWSDPDLGSSTNDFAGCDSTLNLGFVYNSTNNDAVYAGIGLAPPAVGYVFLNGMSTFTGQISDSAIVNLSWQKGFKYVNYKPMCSFIYFGSGGGWVDPPFNYDGAQDFYIYLKGYIPIGFPQTPFPESVSDYTSYGVYILPGDPVSATGKIDGVYDGPGDRRLLCITGPINLNLGDTIEIDLALVFGSGINNLSSITNLKSNTSQAISFFNELVLQNTISEVIDQNDKTILTFSLNQNYPNPFNPTTKITWQSPVAGNQTLKVYDVLGNEVATLVNEFRNAGIYESNFDASKLSSGVYFYQLKAGGTSTGSGQSFIRTKKMILIK